METCTAGQWMSGKGNCDDTAAVETFFKTIKAELIWRDTRDTRRQAGMAIVEYINGFYNPRHRHSALGWESPVAFERKVAKTSTRSGTKRDRSTLVLGLAWFGCSTAGVLP
jgi:transposase InsO family protein